MNLKRVVVTGLGALTPIGNNVQDYWKSLSNGVSGAAPITRFNAEKSKTKFACEVKDFHIENFLEKKEARKMDPFTQYAVIAAEQAVRDSKMDSSNTNYDRVGVIWGSGIGGLR